MLSMQSIDSYFLVFSFIIVLGLSTIFHQSMAPFGDRIFDFRGFLYSIALAVISVTLVYIPCKWLGIFDIEIRALAPLINLFFLVCIFLAWFIVRIYGLRYLVVARKKNNKFVYYDHALLSCFIEGYFLNKDKKLRVYFKPATVPTWITSLYIGAIFSRESFITIIEKIFNENMFIYKNDKGSIMGMNRQNFNYHPMMRNFIIEGLVPVLSKYFSEIKEDLTPNLMIKRFPGLQKTVYQESLKILQNKFSDSINFESFSFVVNGHNNFKLEIPY